MDSNWEHQRRRRQQQEEEQKEEGEVRFQSSNNDVINEEILPDSEKSTKWMLKPVMAPISKLSLLWKIAMKIASGGIVRINARHVLTQNDFIIISGVIELFLCLTKRIFVWFGIILFIEVAVFFKT